MKKLIFTLHLMLAAAVSGICQEVSIIPKPLHLEVGSGEIKLTETSKIYAGSESAKKSAQVFNAFLHNRYGFELPITSEKAAGTIHLEEDAAVEDESYELKVTAGGIQVKGGDAGLLYGLHSLLQLVEKNDGDLTVPAVSIADKPEFAYRGLMIDVSRHFRSLDQMKKIVDLMAHFKFNRLHWHLTDDQGWRLEIKKYPKLTEISAWRDSTIVGPYNKPFVYDGNRHGGYYTQEEAKELVAYAADRKITVIPEIELPGHSSAVLAAYPELGSFAMDNGKTGEGTIPATDEKGTPLNNVISTAVPGYWGVHYNIFGPKEETFRFLEDVLTEVMEIFPSEYIHIGGDEVPKDHWKTSEIAQEVIKRENLEDEHELQSYFITRIEKFLNAHDRNLIGWDEILEGGLAPNATVMSWRGEEGGIAAAKLNHDVIMTPNSHLYLDHAQAEGDTEPLAFCCFLPLDKVYSYNPRPESLTEEQQKHILGVQGNLWTEYIPSDAKVEYMLFPRVLALAEVAWMPKGAKDFVSFTEKRLSKRLRELEALDVNFRIPEARVEIQEGSNGRKMVSLTPFVEGAEIYYTVDGQRADRTAIKYTEPFHLPITKKDQKVRYIIVTPGNRESVMYTYDITKTEAINLSENN